MMNLKDNVNKRPTSAVTLKTGLPVKDFCLGFYFKSVIYLELMDL